MEVVQEWATVFREHEGERCVGQDPKILRRKER